MKTIKLILLSLMVVSLGAQELDKEFLDSLPDDIKKDLEDKNARQELNSQETYRPYLYSSKLRQTEELLSLKDRLELDLLELERRLKTGDNLTLRKDLVLYGSDFFNTFQTSFMPINEPNPDSGYTLDIGDILQIQLVGQNDYIKDFPVNSDGSVSLPDIGKITIAGLSLNDASELIKSKVNAAFIGTEAFINLSQIRDVNILVTGNAQNPGIYTLTGNSNILHAISAAGGISEFGSLREINLIRDNNVIESLDVYDLLIEGKYNIKKRLRSGDVVFVQPRKNIVTIDGAVNRPAKYEALDDQNLNSIIQYANGITRNADRENFSLERILDGTLKTIPVRNDTQFKTIEAEDGDLVYIREHPYRQAKITGAVLKPGSYTMAAGETINDLIQKAGGYTENAYQFGAIYLNEDAKLINELSKEILYQEFLDNILALSQQNISGFDLTPIIKLTEEIKDTEVNGRVVVDLLNQDTIDLYNIKEGDELFVPERNNVVYVYGETSTEGAVMFSENKSVEYFVDKSGGFKKFADNESIYILHPNGESQLYRSKRNIFESRPKSEIKIYPGSIIFVPRALDESAPRRLATQAYVSILGNLGIALASLSAINDD
jgi:polysaccharide export outer membrane protein|tara:strand:- start:1120 stop:2937 length:1818 start_codon:yes stop_codon:yes gene_type:complete